MSGKKEGREGGRGREEGRGGKETILEAVCWSLRTCADWSGRVDHTFPFGQ